MLSTSWSPYPYDCTSVKAKGFVPLEAYAGLRVTRKYPKILLLTMGHHRERRIEKDS